MESLKAFVQRNLFPLLMLLIAGGFAIIVLELLWTGHWDGLQMIGLIASITGVVLGLAALFVKGSGRVVLAVLFLVLSLTGLVGVFEHNEERTEGGEASRTPVLVAASGDTMQPVAYRVQENEKGGGEAIPPLAPLSLAGLSLMGAVVLLGFKQE